MQIPGSFARLRILLITYCIMAGLCACGSASDSLPAAALTMTGPPQFPLLRIPAQLPRRLPPRRQKALLLRKPCGMPLRYVSCQKRMAVRSPPTMWQSSTIPICRTDISVPTILAPARRSSCGSPVPTR